MSPLPSCRLLLETEPHSGAWNMAVDEVLLDSAVWEGVATFRWYRWSEPTVSLGYFQDLADVGADPQLASLPVVRRLSGGGAILHDREWTYSFAVPASQQLVPHPEALYDLVHAGMIEVLQNIGCAAQPRGETVAQLPEPVLCFSRRDSHDIVWQGHKILGSAQRRRKGAILQHGSLLLECSDWTPQHLGIHNLGVGQPITRNDLSQIPVPWTKALVPGTLSTAEDQHVCRIVAKNVLRWEMPVSAELQPE